MFEIAEKLNPTEHNLILCTQSQTDEYILEPFRMAVEPAKFNFFRKLFQYLIFLSVRRTYSIWFYKILITHLMVQESLHNWITYFNEISHIRSRWNRWKLTNLTEINHYCEIELYTKSDNSYNWCIIVQPCVCLITSYWVLFISVPIGSEPKVRQLFKQN